MTLDMICSAVREKYDFTDDEINRMTDDIIFANRPKVVKGKNILIVDGGFTKMSDKFLYFNNIIAFPCNDLKFQEMCDITVLQDDRIYGVGHNTINYIKKILFSRYRDIGESLTGNLVYATSNARKVDRGLLEKISNRYSGNFLLLTDEKMDLPERFATEKMPVKNLFEKFDTYIYTPTPRKRDCSPRFIAECAFYGKKVEYFIDYFGVDKGLYYRRKDIETDFDSISLKHDDDIIDIIKGIIWTNTA
jgi:hypothetical protein